MKVLYFHQHFSTPKGAAGIRSYAMARKLIDRGHSVTIVCGSYVGGNTGLDGKFHKGRREGAVDGIHIIEFGLAYSNHDGFIKRSNVFLKFALRSIGLAFSQSYDVLFATTTPLTACIPGIFSRWLRSKPFVFEVRDLWPELPREMGVIKNSVVLHLMAALEWLSYRSAHRLIGLSPGIVNGIARLGVKHENIAMIPNGCDLAIFSKPITSWRPDGVAPTDLMAVFTGTHGMANGLDAVLNVSAILKQRQRQDIKIVLIGQGKLKPALQARAQAEGLDNIIFHPPVDKQTLAGLMASTDIGLQILANVPAFYYGTSPNKFFDYIAAGLPVLNNYPGWLADMITEHQCGFAVPPDNAESFADALEKAAAQRDLLKIMGANARQLAETQFDREQLSNQFVDWLEGAKKL
jgi:glycosyltransferase involved in cell wall biosynthesis